MGHLVGITVQPGPHRFGTLSGGEGRLRLANWPVKDWSITAARGNGAPLRRALPMTCPRLMPDRIAKTTGAVDTQSRSRPAAAIVLDPHPACLQQGALDRDIVLWREVLHPPLLPNRAGQIV